MGRSIFQAGGKVGGEEIKDSSQSSRSNFRNTCAGPSIGLFILVPGEAEGDDGSCRAWVEDGAIEIPPFVGARVGVPIAGAVYTSFVSPGKDVGDVVACFCVVWPELDTGREREQVVPIITAVEICLFEKVGRCETER